MVYDTIFENAKYEHSLPAKSFVRTAVSSGGSISGAYFPRVQKGPDSRGVRAPPVHIDAAVAISKAPGSV